jgi:penicillin-binding protein A
MRSVGKRRGRPGPVKDRDSWTGSPAGERKAKRGGPWAASERPSRRGAFSGSALGKWAGIGVALGIIAALFPIARGQFDVGGMVHALALRRDTSKGVQKQLFDGLDLVQLEVHPRRVSAELPEGGTALLTLDPELQRAATRVMRRYRLPEAGTVLMDVQTGDLLVYASYVNKGPAFDVNARAEAPAASVFKVITGAALIEYAGLSAETEQCYHGGRSGISMGELEDDPDRDKWCASLAAAMGRSLNVVFGRLAHKHLSVEQLSSMAGAFGFAAPVPFEAPNQAPIIDLPEEPLEFARSAAGFWHTSLSPLAAVSIAQAIANQGVALTPRIVKQVLRGEETLYEASPRSAMLRRAVQPETAIELTRMMVQTTMNGSARKAFFDKRGRPFIPGVTVAGKTGTLSRHKQNRHYTWFVGFAPADEPEVAVSALVVNTPEWRIKGPDLAREVLSSYFKKRQRAGSTHARR